MFEWDEAKRRQNLLKHGVDFQEVWEMSWEKAFHAPSPRPDQSEERWVAFVPYEERVHVCVYTERARARRIISLRKANKREQRYYEEAMGY